MIFGPALCKTYLQIPERFLSIPKVVNSLGILSAKL